MRTRSLALVAAVAVASPLRSQSPMTTIFAGGNGLTGNAAVYFDVTINVPISITQIDVNAFNAGTTTIELWTCPGAFAGNDANPAAWTRAGLSGVVTAAPTGSPTAAVLTTPVVLQPGGYGIAIVHRGTAGPAYTTGTGANNTFTNAEMTLVCGASGGIFSGAVNAPRVWNGSLHYTTPSGTAALAGRYGTGCYRRFTSFYENFAPTPFDLANSAMTLILTGGSYLALQGTSTYVAPSPSAMALSLIDDGETTVALPSPFPYPGGTTTNLVVCSNGFVSAAPGNGTAYLQNTNAFLNAPQASWRCWHDYNPMLAGSGPVRFEVANGVAYVTWDGVADFVTPGSASTFQFQFELATGTVHYVWQSMSLLGNGHLVGFSPAGPSADPGRIDLSAEIQQTFMTAPADGGGELLHEAASRAVLGTNVDLVTRNVPAAALAGFQILGFTRHSPGISTGPLGMPGCFQYVSLDFTALWLPAGSVTYPLAIPNVAAYAGIPVYAQALALVPGVNPLGALTSNGVSLLVGNW